MRENSKRQLIALMFSDVVGYASLTTENEARALQLLDEYRAVFRRVTPLYGGRENKTIGDAFFIEFGSALEAVLCAMEIQTALYERNLTVPRDERLRARIGIHLGDVVLTGNDSFGEGVNVAARIEAFADPGGIVVSRQVADQLLPYEKIPLVRLGRRSLKHIRTAAELFKVRMPWERARTLNALLEKRLGGLARTFDTEPSGNALLYGMAVALIGIFAYLTGSTVTGFQRALAGGRAPASATSNRLALNDGWQFTLASYQEAGNGDGFDWRPVQPHNPHYVDILAKPYWLRRRFVSGRSWQSPALVLGPISGAHRVFLNGRFIGGSESVFTMAYYAFDPTLLDDLGENTLLVKVDPKPSLTPGIVRLPNVGSFLGEFPDVYTTVTRNEFYFHVVQSIYLALALLSFLGCLTFYLFNSRDKKYLYFAIYLLLGTMSLLHSNGIVCSFLDFRLQRAFRLFGLSLSSVVLLSTYFHLIGARRGELANNLLGLVWMAMLVVLLLVPNDGAGVFLGKWNRVLFLTLIYSCCWLMTMINYRTVRMLVDADRWRAQLTRLRYEALLILFGVLTAMLALSSMKTPATGFLPRSWLSWFFTLGTTYPFFFAAGVITLGLVDYILKTHAVQHRRRADDLVLGIGEVLRRSAPGDAMIQLIQERLREFVEAERSTVYLHEDSGPEPTLRALSVLGSREGKRMVAPQTSAQQGILGYVCQTQLPLLVRDLSADFRLRHCLVIQEATAPRTYKTASCMLFPLVIDHRLVGVLTFADKRGNRTFNRHDFSQLHAIAKDLAMVIHARNLAQSFAARAANAG